MASLKIRAIVVELVLQKGTFPNSVNNSKKIYGFSLPHSLHIDVSYRQAIDFKASECETIIYGQSLEDCFALTKYNSNVFQYENSIKIRAGYITQNFVENLPANLDENNLIKLRKQADNLKLVHSGIIISAYADFNDKNRPFIIRSTPALGLMTHQIDSDFIPVDKPQKLKDVCTNIVDSYNKKYQNLYGYHQNY